jgi:hypothetical protein
MQPVFTFLLLTGASSFVVVHNHISDMPEASESDKMITKMMGMLATAFDMEFIGHMIINPNGYIIDGGTMDGVIAELSEDGEIVSWNSNEEDNECDAETSYNTSEDIYEAVKKLRKRVEGR